jgi:hypothetical protein
MQLHTVVPEAALWAAPARRSDVVYARALGSRGTDRPVEGVARRRLAAPGRAARRSSRGPPAATSAFLSDPAQIGSHVKRRHSPSRLLALEAHR